MTVETRERTERNVPKLANQIVVLLLHSPLHRLVSKNLLLLTFKGRKTGKFYTIPVGYGRRGNTLILFTDHQWYKNLVVYPKVKVRLQGKELTGIAEVIRKDKALTAEEMASFVRQHPGVGRAYSVTFDANGQLNQETLRSAAERFMLIRVHLDQ